MANTVKVVKFWAPWCGPCKVYDVEYKKASEAIGDRAEFTSINVDEDQALASQCLVMSVPTTVIIVNNVPVSSLVGFQRSQEVVNAVEHWISYGKT
jgi:thioredoxin 1